jgi:hypothetical protein
MSACCLSIFAQCYVNAMYKKIFLLCTLCFGIGVSLLAQENQHPTIDSLVVNYSSVDGNVNTISNGIPTIKVKAEATFKIKAIEEVAKISFKMIDNVNYSVIYEVNYLLSQAPLTENGVTLFSKQDSVVKIANPSIVTLNIYKYEISTEDFEGESSVVFTTLK